MPLKPPGTYARQLAALEEVRLEAPQQKYYVDLENMVRLMLADVDVSPLGIPPMTTPTGGPVAGLGKLLP